jgi:hypothetical protein
MWWNALMMMAAVPTVAAQGATMIVPRLVGMESSRGVNFVMAIAQKNVLIPIVVP